VYKFIQQVLNQYFFLCQRYSTAGHIITKTSHL